MALQDLTPQLRTRLSRMERAVGWFVFLATALLLFGFGYYVYHTAARKGWFIPKINYQTSLNNAAGLKVGDPVMLMGFNVGDITRIEANGPYEYYNVTVFFRVKRPYYGYLWSDSTVKVAAADFLGNRNLEVTKGVLGVPTIEETNNVAVGLLNEKFVGEKLKDLMAQGKSREEALGELNVAASASKRDFYGRLTADSVYWLTPAESPALTERLEKIVSQAEQALPNILALTNQLQTVLMNGASAASNLNTLAIEANPVVSDLKLISAQLREPGGLGVWALGTNGAGQLNDTIADADTNMNRLVESLAVSLDHLAGITSNLNAQVQSNTNILGDVSKAVVDADGLVQCLKKHWFLRSAFKTKATNVAPATKH